MPRQVHAEGTYAHYVTFSCYKRRRMLDPDHAKKAVIGTLGNQLRKHCGICCGFVVMPDHVHALVWFSKENLISEFMDKWKEISSKNIRAIFQERFPNCLKAGEDGDPIWQEKYYGFNIYSEAKLREKVEYMHYNPVRAGLVKEACEWPWGSARFWFQNKSVGVPISWVR